MSASTPPLDLARALVRARLGLVVGGLVLLVPLIPGRAPLLLVGLAIVALIAAGLRPESTT